MRRHFFLFLAFLALGLGLFGHAQPLAAATTAVADSATTDDQTAVLIDLTANDYDTEGRPLAVSLGTNGCPGNVDLLFDGTVLFTPTSAVQAPQNCTIGYTVNGRPSSLSLTLTPGGDGGPGNPGACGGNWGTGVVQPSGSQFTYQGQPIFLAGYYPGMHALTRAVHLSQPPTDSDYYIQLIDALAARNINLFRAFLTTYSAIGNTGRNMVPHPQHPSSCCTASPPANSNVGWQGVRRYDLDQWDEAFFDHWEAIIAHAESKGMIMELAFFENRLTWQWENVGTVVPNKPDFAAGRKYSLLASQNNVNGVAIDNTQSPAQWYSSPAALQRQTAFVRETMKRLGGFPNVLWELSNEPPIPSRLDPAILGAWEAQICTALRQGEIDGGHPRHAIVQVDIPEHRDVDGHQTPGNDENFSGVHTNLVADFGNGSGPPLIADNDCCFNAGSGEARRKKSWTSVISGAHPLLFDFKSDEFYNSLVNSNSVLTIVERVGYPRKLVLERGLDFVNMVPRDDLVSNSGGDVWMRAKEGDEYLVYYLTSGSATFAAMPANFVAEWFDPRSGRYLAAQPSAVNGQSATFQTPACGDFNPPSPDCNGNSDWVLYLSRQSDVPTSQRAFGGTPRAVGPGAPAIEFEHYDEMVDAQGNVVPGAGQDEAYFDSTPGNAHGGGGFRPDEDVDAVVSGRTQISHTTNGEWLEYTVDVQQTGPYAMHLIYASRQDAGDGQLRLQAYASGALESSLTVPLDNTNDADPNLDWRYFTHCQTMPLTAGTKTLRIELTNATYNLDKFQLVPASTTQSPYGGTPRAIPGMIEAEHYDVGATTGYCDSTPENLGTDFRSDEWVDIAHGNGNYVIAWAPAGEWMEYSVQVNDPGTHEVEVTYATLNSGLAGRARIQVFSAGNVEDSVVFDLPPNGAPGPYEDLIVGDLTLTAGPKEVRFEYLEGNFAFAKMRIGDDTPPDPPVAEDDRHWVPKGSTYTIAANDLLANDEPRNEVEIDLAQPIVSQPQLGTVTWDAANGNFIYQSDPNTNSTQYFEYRIRLSSHPSVTDVGRVTLYPIAEAPVARNDSFIMPPNTTLSIYGANLLANDDGTWLNVGGIVNFIPGLTQGSNAYLYTPSFNSGTAQFQYWATDFNGTDSNIATVTITVSPSAGRPVANDDSFMMAQKRTDGDRAKLGILWAHVFANDVAVQNGIMRIAGETPAQHGLLEFGHIGGWNYYPPHANWQGTDSFSYLLEEAGINSAHWAEVEITVVPAPVGGADSFQTGHDTPLVLNYENDLLRNDNGFAADLSLLAGSWSQPAHGTLTTHRSTGQVTYTPDPGWSGTETFTYVLANELDGQNATWLTRSTPVPVTVTVEPPDAVAHADEVLVRRGATRVDIPLSSLFLNDTPADELVLVGHGPAGLGTVVRVGDELRYSPAEGFERFGEDTFTYTVRRFGGNPNVQPTATVTLRSEGTFDSSFEDDFEGVDLSAWDRVILHNTHTAEVTTDAAMSGVQGLAITLGGGTGSAFVEHHGTEDASHVAVAFAFDPSALQMAATGHHPMVHSAMGTVAVRNTNGTLQVKAWVNRDTGGANATGWYDLTGGPQQMRVEWKASSAPGQSDGFTRLWIDGVLRGEKGGVDNDTFRAGWLRLGAIWGIDVGTTGVMAFDGVKFEIGPQDQPFFATDNFNAANFNAWTGAPQGGGTLSHVLDGADNRLAVNAGGQGTYAYVYDDSLERETHLGARFEFDPGTLVLPDGQNFFLYGGVRINKYWGVNLRLRRFGGQFQIALQALNDADTWSTTGWHTLPTGASELAMEWWAAGAPGRDDGGIRLWINDTLIAERLDLDNDRRWINRLNLGAAAAMDAGTSGTFYIDDYSAWRGHRSREFQAYDEFTGGLGGDWSHEVEVGGSVDVVPVAAFGNSEAVGFTLNSDAKGIYIRDTFEQPLLNYTNTMRLHTGSLTMTGGSFILNGASRIGHWVASSRLGWINGQFHVRLVATTDGGVVASGWYPLGNAADAHDLVLDWWAASAPGADDGGARLYLNNTLIGDLTGLDNDTHYIEQANIGAPGGIDAGTVGTFYVDDFESWR